MYVHVVVCKSHDLQKIAMTTDKTDTKLLQEQTLFFNAYIIPGNTQATCVSNSAFPLRNRHMNKVFLEL